ncbi:MAG: serine hydrolase [Chitinophagaceae bacterium]
MKKTAIFIVLFSLNAEIKAQSFNSAMAAMLQDTLNTYVSQIPNIKGFSASVYIPGQGMWTGTTGFSKNGQPITPDMRMGIASNSKLFVSAVMLKLAEKNIITLNDSLKKWLPAYPNVNPNITIRQLLNHSSGISDPIFISPWMDTINAHPTRVFTSNEVLSWLGAPYFQPGTGWGYSNVNYILAGMIAKNATGYSISRLIRDSILSPLNMDSSFYDVEEPENGTIAHRWWNSIDYHDTSRVGLNTAGGCAGALFSTASEMAQWYTALFNGRILNATSMNQLIQFIQTGSATYQYGLGISRETTQNYVYWGHGGSTWGYRSKMIYDSCLHVTVCGLTNSFPSGMDAVSFLLYRAVKNHIPGCSGPVSGINNTCQGTNAVTYTVPLIPGASSYSWELPPGVTGSSSTNTIMVNFGPAASSGNIIVHGVNNYGPGGFSVLPVTVKPLPPTPVISQNGNTLISNAPSGNQWYDGNGPIAGAIGSSYTITGNGNYYCIVTLNGCSSAPSNSINAVVTGVTNLGDGNSWKIYPNPVSGYFFNEISGTSLINATLNIYNTGGSLVKSVTINQHLKKISVSNLSGGIYLVELITGQKRLRQKLVLMY